MSSDARPEFVIAFDRDYTVSTLPKPDRELVPIDWVRAYSHNYSNVDALAIGNQKLCEEANILGIERIAEFWADTIHDNKTIADNLEFDLGNINEKQDLLEKAYDAYTEYYSTTDFEFIVVDDLDLSDTPHWTHYYPWDFVHAVENNDLNLSSPDTTGF